MFCLLGRGSYLVMYYFFAALAFAIAAFLALAAISGVSLTTIVGIVAAGLAIMALAAAFGGGPAITWRRVP